MLFVACDGVIDMLLVNRQSVGIQKSDISIAEKNRISPKDDFSAKPGVRRRKMKGTQDVPFPTVTGGNEATLSGSHLSGSFCIFAHFPTYCLPSLKSLNISSPQGSLLMFIIGADIAAIQPLAYFFYHSKVEIVLLYRKQILNAMRSCQIVVLDAIYCFFLPSPIAS